MKSRRYLGLAGLIAVFVVLADQLSKIEVRANVSVGERVDVIGPLEFTHTHNDGVAFGMASGGGIVVILLSLGALVALGAFLAHPFRLVELTSRHTSIAQLTRHTPRSS